jgi:type IV pilus assembly protein PilY1
MKTFTRLKRQPAVLALLVAAAVGGSSSAVAQLTDISQMPLASASNLSVLPNIMFILDDSGSMMFDEMPDHIDTVTGGAERRYLHEAYQCKPRGVTTVDLGPDPAYGSVGNRLATNCDRVDPPFGASEYNGLYYNPQLTYRPPLNANGTPFSKITTWTNVPCDPFPTGWGCKEWQLNQDYYQSGYVEVDVSDNGSYDPQQSITNANIKEWYGTSSSFDVQTKFPEVVYCSASASISTTADLSDLTKCRRNGLTGDARHTGNPFEYKTARWRRGYPEAEPIHEFWRTSGTTTVATVTTAYPHGIPSGTGCRNTASAAGTAVACQIIPRTGSGTTGSGYDTAGTNVPTNVTGVPTANSLTYNLGTGRTGQVLRVGGFDLVVRITKVSGTVLRVAQAFNHDLQVDDRINLTQLSCSGCSSTTQLNQTNRRVSAIVDANTFDVEISTSNSPIALGFYRKTNLFNVPRLRNSSSNPFYYTIEPTEYCSDAALTTCQKAVTPGVAPAGFPHAAPVRYCRTPFDANRLDTPTGNLPGTTLPRCRKKFEEDVASNKGFTTPRSGYVVPRYGQFRRGDITSAGSFGGRPLRYDCAARPTCSYSEEMQNFVNWFAYYRTRMLTMKTTSGISFAPINDRYRVGFVTINPGSPVDSSEYLKIDKFTATHKADWYDKFYKQRPDGGTPLTEALSRVGRHFAGKQDKINSGMNDDPIEYSCQQNFALLTTDGYWSARDGADIAGNSLGDVDNVLSTRNPRGLWDGAIDGGSQDPDAGGSEFSTSSTLADIALYYYQTDLRPTGTTGALGTDVSDNNVPSRQEPITGQPSATWQHMVTFGLGMAEGLMDWRADYESPDATGDFDAIRKGSSGCAWASGTCNWPVPGSRRPANLDDLWHAAVNGRGKFFYARDTQAVQDGLYGALTALQERGASGAAAATSTPNITPTDRAIFTTTYTTVQWNGDVVAQLIDDRTGTVSTNITWSAKEQLQGRVSPTTDSRTIYMYDSGASNGLKPFQYASLTATEKGWFDNKCTPLSNLTQCATLDPTAELPLAQSGTNMVNFLRGHTLMETNGIYRDRRYALGDTVNAVPVYVGRPRLSFADAVPLQYSDWKEQPGVKNRTPTVYVGANDGMLHAFNADTGSETWAYVPRIVAPNLWRLAESQYATKHQYFVDGSPSTMDIWDGSTWRTILVGSLNAGGRGYYALDVTDPASPRALWEFCNDSTLCPIADADLGYSYGLPIITKRKSDGKWVVLVTSGYNNVPATGGTGNGQGYLYILDALTGSVLDKIGTGVGSATTPSGLGRMSGWVDNLSVDNTVVYLYVGDLLGNIWRFDLTTSTPSLILLAQARDGSGKLQPITTSPELGLVDNVHKVLFVGTGRYLGATDLTDPGGSATIAWQQSIYAFKDTGVPLGNLRSTLVQQTLVNASSTTRTVSNSPVSWGSQNGWFMDLNPGNTSPGERVNVDPQLVGGTLVVVTNVPGGGACSIGGDSWTYQFDYESGGFVFGSPGNRVGVKQTGALAVGLVIYKLEKGSLIGQLQRSNTEKLGFDILTKPTRLDHRRINWRDLSPTN